ncbi:MAG: c-type cytochrome [Myxococcota bacterium]
MIWGRTWIGCSGLALMLACSAEPKSAVERGRELFESSTALSTSRLNTYACSTCHDERAGSGLRKPGAPLAGATLRPSFWGGQENDLLRSINACRTYFMLTNVPLQSGDADAEALFAYLESLEPGDPNPVAFDVVTEVEPLARGDANLGAGVYASACSNCHGAPHSGTGRLSERVSILPEDTFREHAEYSLRVQRLIFIEKIRHGRFLGYGGEMPPFSTQLLTDADVSNVLEYLSVFGE